MYNFQLVNVDTDSISICKQGGFPFSKEEQTRLLEQLNKLYPETIVFDPDGYFPKVVVLRAKNYILYDGQKIKTKGSALRSPQKEKALQEFIKRVIETLVYEDDINVPKLQLIYKEYVKEIMAIQDINRWVTKKTISEKMLTSERTNETKVMDALDGEEFSEGDKIFTFYEEDNLVLAKNFKGCYNKDKLLEKLYKTSKIFETILPKDIFINYKLKRNKKLLEEILLNE